MEQNEEERNIITFEGFLITGEYGECDEVLYLQGDKEPLAYQLEEEMSGKQVTVRYWATEKQATKEQAQFDFIRQVMGDAYCDFGAVYSDYTGYLWTDEEIKVGGHDLIKELYSLVSMWLILEVEIH